MAFGINLGLSIGGAVGLAIGGGGAITTLASLGGGTSGVLKGAVRIREAGFEADAIESKAREEATKAALSRLETIGESLVRGISEAAQSLSRTTETLRNTIQINQDTLRFLSTKG